MIRDLFRHVGLAFKYGPTYKAMLRSPDPFGPRCATCGLPDIRALPRTHQDALRALLTLEPLASDPFCRCYLPEAMRPTDRCSPGRHVEDPDGIGCRCGRYPRYRNCCGEGPCIAAAGCSAEGTNFAWGRTVSGWVELGVPDDYTEEPPRARLVGEQIHLSGTVKPGLTYTLPEGYRPAVDAGWMQTEKREGRLFAQLTRIGKDGIVTVEHERDMGPAPYDPREDPNLESVTYGQGNFGYRCVVCRADDYNGPIEHAPGCAGRL